MRKHGHPSTSSSRLRVLVVIPSRQIWGAERSVLALAPLLEDLGIDLVLGSPPGGDLELAWLKLGLQRAPLELPIHAGIRSDTDHFDESAGRPRPRALAIEVLASVRTVRQVAQAARAVSVVHSNSLWQHLDCALAGRLARRPVVIELHDLVRPGIGRQLLSTACRLSSATVAISTAVAGVVGGGSSTRVQVVTQAVDLQRFSPGRGDPAVRRLLTDDPNGPLVGIVGRVDRMKGVDVLVRAMALLRGAAANARLAVVGSAGLDASGYDQEVRAEASRLLGERVRFVGSTDEVPAVLRSLDVLVNASSSEPFGLSVLEAQASGVPVVATRAGGIPDFVTDGDNGLLVPPGDAESLARALERLLLDLDLRRQLGRRGRETAVADHGLERRAGAFAEIYRAVAQRGPV